jgi:Fe-S cluster assembly protein SufD
MSIVAVSDKAEAWYSRLMDQLVRQGEAGNRADESVRARAALTAAVLPGQHDESWRFTPLASLWSIPPIVGGVAQEVLLARISRYLVPEAAGRRLVFVDGVFQKGLSDLEAVDEGVRFAPLSGVGDCEWRSEGAALFAETNEFFSLVNLALQHDGACLRVPRACRAGGIYQILYVQTGLTMGLLSAPRTVVDVGSQSVVAVVQSFVSLDEGEYIHNELTECYVAPGARFSHTRVQSDSRRAVHVGTCAVGIGRDGRYDLVSITLGGALSRFFSRILQEGTGVAVSLSGLALLGGTQIADTHSVVDHALPHGHSMQLHKCIVAERAKAVFNGKVIVRPGAQLTDSAQSSRSLLLSPKASVDTKPELEIYADDVKCSHGAAIGQLEEESLFYLASRGIPESVARDLLTYAFAAEVLESVAVGSLRERLQDLILRQTDRTRQMP